MKKKIISLALSCTLILSIFNISVYAVEHTTNKDDIDVKLTYLSKQLEVYDYIDRSYNAAGKTGTSQSFIDTDNNGVIDTETITSSFVGYVPSDNPKYSIMVTSPNSSVLL